MDQFHCQSCHVRLQLTGVEALRDVEAAAEAARARPAAQQQGVPGAEPSGHASPRPSTQRHAPGAPQPHHMEESFVVLDGAQRGASGQHVMQPAGGSTSWFQLPIAAPRVLQQTAHCSACLCRRRPCPRHAHQEVEGAPHGPTS